MAVTFKSRSSKLTLAITAQPTTTEYLQGDSLNLTGIQVMATRRDGTPVDVTSSCTFSPANGTTISSSGTITVTATYHGKTATTTVTSYAIDRIAVTTAPTKTAYDYGDTMSYSGIVVTAYANNDVITRDVTTSCSYNPASGTTLTTTGSFSATITWRNKSTTQAYTVTAVIYGAEWAGGSSSAWTRTDDAANFSDPSPAVNNGYGSSPFDNIMPWSGMIRVEERTAYAGNQVLVKIPKFYYKWTRTGAKMKLQISMTKVSGFYTSPAHADRGDGKGERDYVYVGAYHTTKVGSYWYSYSGTTPTVNITRATARSGIHATNSTQWQWDYAMYWTIAMLYLVEYADWDSQRKIGKGSGDSSLSVTGKTDAMKYHTGTNATSRSTKGHVRYRYIEDLWANIFDFIDGVSFNGTNVYVCNNPANNGRSDSYSSIGSIGSSAGYVVTTSFDIGSGNGKYALLPKTFISCTDTNTFNTYSCDDIVTGGTQIYTGSFYEDPGYANGLFASGIDQNDNFAEYYVGCRLMKLP